MLLIITQIIWLQFNYIRNIKSFFFSELQVGFVWNIGILFFIVSQIKMWYILEADLDL